MYYSLKKSLSIKKTTTGQRSVIIVGHQPSNKESTVALFLVPSLWLGLAFISCIFLPDLRKLHQSLWGFLQINTEGEQGTAKHPNVLLNRPYTGILVGTAMECQIASMSLEELFYRP